MPTRGMIDENGLIISHEYVQSLPPAKKTARVKSSSSHKQVKSAVHQSDHAKQSRSHADVTERKQAAKLDTSVRATVKCPLCNVTVRVSRIQKHNRKCHLDKTTVPKPSIEKHFVPPTLVRCTACGAMVREDNLSKHLRKVHSGKTRIKRTTIKSPHPTQTRVNISYQPSGQHVTETYTQASDETRYGDKYLGQTYRESSGMFGSLPLYDDYSEESGPG